MSNQITELTTNSQQKMSEEKQSAETPTEELGKRATRTPTFYGYSPEGEINNVDTDANKPPAKRALIGGKATAKATAKAGRPPLPTNSARQKKAAAATTAAASKKKKKAPAKKSTTKVTVKKEAPKKRPPKFTEVEDIAICKAFAAATTNPRKGAYQKKSVFWEDVFERFKVHHEEDTAADEVAIEFESLGRTPSSVSNRFNRQIQPNVLAFNRYYRKVKIEKPSGFSKHQWMDLAAEKYLEDFGRKFQFQEQALILHELPKCDPMTVDADNFVDDFDEWDEGRKEDQQKRTHNEIGNVMGQQMERPIGNKKAKAAAAAKAASVASLDSGIQEMTEQGNSMNNILIFKSVIDSLMEEAQLHRAMGDMEEVKRVLLEIKDKRNQLQLLLKEPKSAAASTATAPVSTVEVDQQKQPAADEGDDDLEETQSQGITGAEIPMPGLDDAAAAATAAAKETLGSEFHALDDDDDGSTDTNPSRMSAKARAQV